MSRMSINHAMEGVIQNTLQLLSDAKHNEQVYDLVVIFWHIGDSGYLAAATTGVKGNILITHIRIEPPSSYATVSG